MKKTQSRLLILHKLDQKNQHRGTPPPVAAGVPHYSISLLQQKPRVRFARKSDAVISMKVTTCPTQEVFIDPFPLELESLFSEDDLASTTFSSKNATTVEPVSALVEPTEWSMLVEDIKGFISGYKWTAK